MSVYTNIKISSALVLEARASPRASRATEWNGIVPAGELYREEITFSRGDAQPAETGSWENACGACNNGVSAYTPFAIDSPSRRRRRAAHAVATAVSRGNRGWAGMIFWISTGILSHFLESASEAFPAPASFQPAAWARMQGFGSAAAHVTPWCYLSWILYLLFLSLFLSILPFAVFLSSLMPSLRR